MSPRPRSATLLLLGLAAAASALPVLAADAAPEGAPVELDTVEVVAPKPRSALGLPAAVDRVDAAELHEGQLQLDIAEGLLRVPGIAPRSRQNYAQDSQLQSRGYGARASFGVRGLQLRLDGVPLGSPDGQGQAGTVSIGALDRIEVLRGPLAYRYGNASGGVIALQSAEPLPVGQYGFDLLGGEHDTGRFSMYAGAPLGKDSSLRLDVQHLETAGARPHSAAQRDQLSARGVAALGEGRELELALSLFDQPMAEDPLGLTRLQFNADPRQAAPSALLYNTRKTARERQASARYSQPLADGQTRVELLGYVARREIEQFLSVLKTAQTAASSAGGVVDTDRDLVGTELLLSRDFGVATLQAGLQWQQLDEQRLGYENFVGDTLGVKGARRRDEDNRLSNFDQFLLLDWPLLERLDLLAALRHSELRLRSDDHYIVGTNRDDSGRLSYSATTPALGLSYAINAGNSVYASAGRGFETPTLTELAYRPDGASGFNRELKAARSRSVELGYKRKLAPGRLLNLTAYDIRTRDEIVPATNSGGRTTFQNAPGGTQRRGVELGIDAQLARDWSARLAADWIRARFEQDYGYTSLGSARSVKAGNRLPGVPHSSAFLELAWRDQQTGPSAALETRYLGSVAVDDTNADKTGGTPLFNARVGWRWPNGLRVFLRAENLADREYAGSVIVNEANGRYFEPGAARSVYLGLRYDGKMD